MAASYEDEEDPDQYADVEQGLAGSIALPFKFANYYLDKDPTERYLDRNKVPLPPGRYVLLDHRAGRRHGRTNSKGKFYFEYNIRPLTQSWNEHRATLDEPEKSQWPADKFGNHPDPWEMFRVLDLWHISTFECFSLVLRTVSGLMSAEDLLKLLRQRKGAPKGYAPELELASQPWWNNGRERNRPLFALTNNYRPHPMHVTAAQITTAPAAPQIEHNGGEPRPYGVSSTPAGHITSGQQADPELSDYVPT
jgi:hypothetical protein